MPGFSPTGCLQKAQTGVLHRFHILVFLVAAFLLFLPSESVGKRNKTNSASRKSQKTSCQKFLRGINLPDNPRKTWKSIRSCTMMIAISKKKRTSCPAYKAELVEVVTESSLLLTAQTNLASKTGVGVKWRET